MNTPMVDAPSTESQDHFTDPIPQIIPFGSLTYLSGASGSGKTIMMAEWFARWQDGRSICGHATHPPTELCYIAADRDWSTYERAFTHAGVDDVKRYVLAEDPDFDPKAWKRTEAFKFLDRCLTKLDPQPGALVIVDPVAPLFVQGKTNDNWDVAVSSHYYRVVARRLKITLICMANVAKQKSEDTYVRPQDRIAGSGAFVAYSDTQIYLQRDQEGILTLGWIPRCHAAEEFQFRFHEATKLFVPYVDVVKDSGLPPHLLEALKLIPHPPACITSPDLVRRIAQERHVKRAMASRTVQQLIEKCLISRDDLGVIRRLDPPAADPANTPQVKTPVDE